MRTESELCIYSCLIAIQSTCLFIHQRSSVCMWVGGHVFKCLWMLPVTGCSNMSMNMSWQPYEPLGCWVYEEQRSRRQRRWEAWPCRWFSQWSNHSYSSEAVVQTGGYRRGCARPRRLFFFCFFFFFPFRASSDCQFHTFSQIRLAPSCMVGCVTLCWNSSACNNLTFFFSYANSIISHNACLFFVLCN